MHRLSALARFGLLATALASACTDDSPTDPLDGGEGSTTSGAADDSTSAEITVGGDTTGAPGGESTSDDPGSTGGATTNATTDADDSDTGTPIVCGDGVAERNEDCDADDLAGQDCLGLGFDGGRLACADDCTFDTTACTSFACGNDLVEGAEVCDGTDLAGQDCLGLGFDAGRLGCLEDCSDWDASSCIMYSCGNDLVEGMEVCDGTDLVGETCLTQGFDDGVLGCAADCLGLDTSGCFMYSCGNDSTEGMEVCDGTDLSGQTCLTLGFDAGTLGCAADCTAFDSSGCETWVCANDVLDPGEVCDGLDLGGQTCLTLGFDAGTLGCAVGCGAFDTSGCVDWAGDCCGPNGTPGCDDAGCTTAICTLDPYCCNTQWDQICADEAAVELACLGVGGSCPALGCGNSVLEAGEVCDGAALGGADCITQGFDGGTLGCAAGCGAYDTSACEDFGGDCCLANGTIGCDDPGCTATICAADPYCCNTQWDQICADAAVTEPSCYDVTPACGPGCGNNMIEGAEVCDGTDVGAETCATQGFDGGPLGCAADCSALDTSDCAFFGGDCCLANGTPGCDDATCTATICLADPYCCNTQWDQICANAALVAPSCAGVSPSC